MVKWIAVACVLVSGCAVQPSPFLADVQKGCSEPALRPEYADCIKIGTLALDAIAKPATGRSRVENVYVALRPYAPYGPTMYGFKDLSPGRKVGETGINSLADGAMHSVQMLDFSSQISARTPSPEELAEAIGKGMLPARS